jgi:hypothetical protein
MIQDKNNRSQQGVIMESQTNKFPISYLLLLCLWESLQCYKKIQQKRFMERIWLTIKN